MIKNAFYAFLFFAHQIPALSNTGAVKHVIKENQPRIDKCIVEYVSPAEVISAQIIIYKEEAYVYKEEPYVVTPKKYKLPSDLSKQLFYYAERICNGDVKVIIKKEKKNTYTEADYPWVVIDGYTKSRKIYHIKSVYAEEYENYKYTFSSEYKLFFNLIVRAVSYTKK